MMRSSGSAGSSIVPYAMPRLLVAGLAIELEPHKIPARGNVRGRHYQASRPRGAPVATSPCTFRALTFLRS